MVHRGDGVDALLVLLRQRTTAAVPLKPGPSNLMPDLVTGGSEGGQRGVREGSEGGQRGVRGGSGGGQRGSEGGQRGVWGGSDGGQREVRGGSEGSYWEAVLVADDGDGGDELEQGGVTQLLKFGSQVEIESTT